MIYLYALLASLPLAVIALWVFYLAVMSLKRARDAGLLTTATHRTGQAVLVVGYLLDVYVNVVVMTPVLLELPKELTVSHRLKRHNLATSGYRKAVAKWFEPWLNPFDPKGKHI